MAEMLKFTGTVTNVGSGFVDIDADDASASLNIDRYAAGNLALGDNVTITVEVGPTI